MNEIVNIRKSESELITTLKSNSTYVIEKDTFQSYWIQDLILEKDTLRKAKIGIKSFPKKCKVYIDQIQLKNENQVYDSFKDFKRIIKKRYGTGCMFKKRGYMNIEVKPRLIVH